MYYKVRINCFSMNLNQQIINFSESSSFSLFVAKDTVAIIRLNVNYSSVISKIDSIILPFHNLNDNYINSTKFDAGLSFDLYQCLFQPIREALTLPDQILVIQDIELMKLPFDLLIDAPVSKSEFKLDDYPSYSDKLLLENLYPMNLSSLIMLKFRGFGFINSRSEPFSLYQLDEYSNLPSET